MSLVQLKIVGTMLKKKDGMTFLLTLVHGNLKEMPTSMTEDLKP